MRSAALHQDLATHRPFANPPGEATPSTRRENFSDEHRAAAMHLARLAGI